MVSSIGPFWDANETWLVLGVGVLLVAFPQAHGMVLSALYLPVTVMLIGLILRGVAFDFRVKAQASHKTTWNRLFALGSLLAATAQGWMLGSYLTGFERDNWSLLFSAGIALTLPTAYAMLGAGWLIMKTWDDLQSKAVAWGNAVFAIFHTVATPRVVAAGYGWVVFASTVLIFMLAFIGVAITLPVIVVYTVFMYRVFWGRKRSSDIVGRLRNRAHKLIQATPARAHTTRNCCQTGWTP
jgi:cytochrome d ubiquinol oxidase subunit II